MKKLYYVYPAKCQLGNFFKCARLTHVAVCCFALLCFSAILHAGLPRQRQLPGPPLGASSTPYYMDISGEVNWVKFAAVCMQGLVNRQEGKLYLNWTSSDDFWLDKYNEVGYGITPVNINAANMASYVGPGQIFAGAVDGLLVYDDLLIPDGSGSWTMLVNVFTAIAGVEDLIPVPASQASNWPLPVVIDATTSSSRTAGLWAGGNNQDHASQWVIQNYPELTQPGHLAHVHPSTLNLRDYFVAFKIMPIFYWEGMSSATDTAFDNALAATGPGQAVIGLWNSPVWGDLDKPLGIGDEHTFLRLISSYGKYNVPTLETGIHNLSYQSGMELKKHTYPESYTEVQLDPDKTYVTFLVSDCDNMGLVWTQGWFMDNTTKWADPQRGQVPVTWTLPPACVDMLPGMVSYLYSTATDKDSFAAAGGGMNYTLLEHYASNYPSQRDQLIRDFARISDDAMEAIGMRTVWSFPEYAYVLEGPPSPASDLPEHIIFNNEASKGAKSFSCVMLDYGNRGGLFGYDDTHMLVEGAPLFLAITGFWDAEVVAQVVDIIHSYTPATKPAFLHVFMGIWPSSPTRIKEVVDALGPDYVAVSAEKLGDLYKQNAYGLIPNIPPTADAGPDQQGWLPLAGGTAEVQLDGTDSFDDGVPGDPLTYQWDVIGSPSGSVVVFDPVGGNTADPQVTMTMTGIYELQLEVDDGEQQDTDTIKITVSLQPNAAPAADAGSDQQGWLTAGNVEFQLDGSGSFDDGVPGPVTYQWSVVESPDGSVVVFDPLSRDAVDTSVTMTMPGIYQLQLEVDDGDKQDTDSMTITVYEDSCAYAKAQPGFVRSPGDMVFDCIVDMDDLLYLASGWISDYDNILNELYTGSRDDFTGRLGYTFRADTNFSINALGRAVNPDFNGGVLLTSHVVELFEVSSGTLIASATIDAGSEKDLLGYAFEPLAVPVEITGGNEYMILSQETAGSGDPWKTNFFATNYRSDIISILGSEFSYVSPGNPMPASGKFFGADAMYVPATFSTNETSDSVFNVFDELYTGSRDDFSGRLGFTFRAEMDFSIAALGRAVNPDFNSGVLQTSHVVELFEVSTGTLLASATIDGSSEKDLLGYAFESLSTPVDITSGQEYMILSEEAADSGDPWKTNFFATNYATDVISILGSEFSYASSGNPMPASGKHFGADALYVPPTFLRIGTSSSNVYDLTDFAAMASDWMNCYHPECP